MCSQSEFVDNLKKRMYESYESKFFLESIACSYAIIENRTKRICEHLDKSMSRASLYEKTQFIYESIKNMELERDKKKRKIVGFLKYRILETNLLGTDFTKEYGELLNKQGKDLQLVRFRKDRNDFTHEMYIYNSENPKLTDFNDYEELARMGIDVANHLCKICSSMKCKIKALKEETK